MIQRIQSVYLALAFVLSALCLCLQVGAFHPAGMGADTYLYNLWKLQPDGTLAFGVWPMFAVLLLSCPVALWAIFSYKNRRRQAKLCSVCMALVVAWAVAYVLFGYVFVDEGVSFAPSFAASLPLVALVLYWLARRAILSDERLVRAADRIR